MVEIDINFVYLHLLIKDVIKHNMVLNYIYWYIDKIPWFDKLFINGVSDAWLCVWNNHLYYTPWTYQWNSFTKYLRKSSLAFTEY